jgi:energy-coupling factor transport system permease protein
MIDILSSRITGKTFLFRLDPRTKFISLLAVFVSLLFTRQILLYIPWLFIAITTIAVARINPRVLFRPLRYFFWLFILTFLFHAALTPGRVFYHYRSIYITFEGMQNGLLFSARLFLIILFTYLFSLTSDPMDLTDGLSRLFSPLRKLRIPVDDFFTIVHISLRFIPTLFSQGRRIALSQKARGLDTNVSFFRRIRYTLPLIIPIMVLSIKRANELALALESRWYDPGKARTSFVDFKLSRLDFGILTFLFIAIGGIHLCAILNF